MFERFTERARQVVLLSQEEARILKHDSVGSEHILLGLLREEEGLAARVLESLGVTVERARAQVLLHRDSGQAVVTGQVAVTEETRALFQQALREALSLGVNYVGTEHLLLALVAAGDELGTEVLRDLDAPPDVVRQKVIALFPGRRNRAAQSGTERPKPRGVKGPQAESLPTHQDRPATSDRLGRARLAEVLAQRLRATRAAGRGDASASGERESFLIHVHARWGEGKSSFLNFLRDSLECQPNPWIVIPFNAWEHQRLAPPWWWLMSAIHRNGRRALWRLSWKRALAFWIRDLGWRVWNVRAAWIPLLFAAALLLVAIDAGLFSGSLSAVGKASAAISAAITLAVTAWGLSRGLSRWLLLGSAPVGARFLKRVHDPLGVLKRRFDRVVAWLHYPVIVFIDDVDRCQAEYVVSLLEGVQTLFVDQPVTYVVSGDRAWVSESYAQVYCDFEGIAPDPTRPLGYLFVEKTFQIALDLPPVNPVAREGYWGQLLRGASAGGDQAERAVGSAEAEAAAWRRVRRLKSLADIDEAITKAPDDPIKRDALLQAASRRLASPELDRDVDHFLQDFGPLVESNPRAMKRLINAHGLERARQVREGTILSDERRRQQVLWIILKLRWPLLAEHLAEHPADADRLLAGRLTKPELLAVASDDRRVRAVLEGTGIGVQLDSEAVSVFAGVGPSAAAVGA
jgi:hypothetical protein